MADLSQLTTEQLLELRAQKRASTVKPSGPVPAAPANINPTESTGQVASVPSAGAPNFSPGGAWTPPAGGPVPTPAPVAETVHEPSLPMQERYTRALAKAPWYEQFLHGLGGAPAAAYQGVKQLVGEDVSDSEIAQVRAAQSTDPGFAGSVIGNVAMLGLPLTKAARGLEHLSKFTTLAKRPVLTRALTAMGLAGAEGATLVPTMEDESRAGNASTAAAVTGGLGTAGRILTQAVRPTKSAKQLMNKGIQPTIAQGAEGGVGKTLGYLEDMTHALPILNTMTGVSRDRAEEELIKVAARRASPYGAAPESINDITRGTWFKKQDDAFDKGYKEVLANQVVNLGGGFKTAIRAQVDSALAGVDDKVKRNVEKVLVKNLGPVGMVSSGEQWHSAFKEIRKAKRIEQDRAMGINKDRDAKNAVEAYKAVEQAMIEARNSALKKAGKPELIDQLANLDEAYAHHQIFLTAAENAKAGGEGGIKLEHLLKAVEDKTPPGLLVRGEGRLQDITEPAKSVFKNSLEGAKDALQRRVSNAAAGVAITGGGGAALGPVGLAALPLIATGSSVAASRPGSKLLFGNTRPQRFLAEKIRNKSAVMGTAIPQGTQSVEEE